MSALIATTYTSRILVDGTLAMVIHYPPASRNAALELFGAPGTEMATAALIPEYKREPEPERKGGEIAKWLGIRCNEPAFCAWVEKTWPLRWERYKDAAEVIRAVCGVESRADLDHDAEAAQRFHDRIRLPYSRVGW